MLTPLATKDDDDAVAQKTSADYYPTHYTPQHHHYYYHPVPFNDDSNNLHHPQTPSLYDATQYYAFSPGYSHPPAHLRAHEDDANNAMSSSIYMPVYQPPHPYPPEEMLFPQKTSDQQPATMYDYNLSPVPSNQIFHQHANYMQPPIEQTHCTTSNGGEYLSPYVSVCDSEEVKLADRSILVTTERSLPVWFHRRGARQSALVGEILSAHPGEYHHEE